MSYYFVIVGTRDNPLYTADLASKPAASSGPSSFFSSSSSSASSASQSTAQTSAASDEASSSANGGSGGIFGFGGSLGLGALAGGLSSRGGGTTGGSQTSARPSSSSATAAGHDASGQKGIGFGRYNDKHVLQMIAHSSLDVVEDKQFANGAMYMKSMDRINEWTTSAFLVPGNIKFLILHEHKHDDGIRNFFLDVWELWTKWIQNPFNDVNAPIPSQGNSFDAKVKASARKHL
ncbi:Sedlin [Jaminaea rosea]|uniref:Sedlin n=1 Tax=Jaminaea rosea TaxID=1569628 RepID=A0A316UYG4_9BASI|nr:Sedlin [Jaminaea rosea]PWN30357.1 Sedlin [Jaminaea rosea]